MTRDLDGIPQRGAGPQRVLITGGASGLGLALATQLAGEGHTGLVTDRAAERPEGVPGRVAYRRLDVTEDADWAQALAWVESEWGGLDMLVNNAGIAQGGAAELMSVEDWQQIVDVNLLGVVRGCLTFIPLLKAQRSGRIVNTASLAGLVHAPGMTTYNTVKAGVVALSETLDHELHPYGISVSAICPSFFRTHLTDGMDGADAAALEVIINIIV